MAKQTRTGRATARIVSVGLRFREFTERRNRNYYILYFANQLTDCEYWGTISGEEDCDMKFVKTDDLKAGMRLAKPIYNKNGVLLYDRNSILTLPGINSVRNFGLIGIYILEPAEPVPPFSREDMEFEQCQTVYMFQLREVMQFISQRKPIDDIYRLTEDILKRYSGLDHRVNFNQNLRSASDFMYKHAISTAVLTAMITGQLGFSHEKQRILVTAALLYDYGYLYGQKHLEKGRDMSQFDRDALQKALEKGIDQMHIYKNTSDLFSKAVTLMSTYIYSFNPARALTPEPEISQMVQVLRVADDFDRMTGMEIGHEPESELLAMRRLMADTKTYRPAVVTALAQSIHIVPVSANVDLSTGDKGIVLVENTVDFMHPVVLRLAYNQIYDLSDPAVASRLQVVDIMKTMDNRISVDEETLRHFVADDRLKKVTAAFQKRLSLAKARKVSTTPPVVDALL